MHSIKRPAYDLSLKLIRFVATDTYKTVIRKASPRDTLPSSSKPQISNALVVTHRKSFPTPGPESGSGEVWESKAIRNIAIGKKEGIRISMKKLDEMCSKVRRTMVKKSTFGFNIL